MSKRVQQLREFIFQEIYEYLTPRDVQQIAYTQALPPVYLSKDGLEVFLKLEMLGKFSETDPAPLAGILKVIGRKDLVKKVEKYTKKQKPKKSTKNSLPINDQLLRKYHQIEASLRIAGRQVGILLEQMEEVKSIAWEIDYRGVADRAAAAVTVITDHLQYELSLATTALNRQQASTDSSLEDSFSSGSSSFTSIEDRWRSPVATLERPNRPRLDALSQTTSLPRNFRAKRQQVKAKEQQPSEEHEYECVGESLWAPQAGSLHYDSREIISHPRQSDSQGIMVTGGNGAAQVRQKPVVAPKPVKKQKSSIQEQIANYTGGSADYTERSLDTSTGDSGFVDARKYRKDSPPPRVNLRHKYTPLQAEQREAAAFYAATNCPSRRPQAQDAEYDEVGKEESPYVNIPILSRSLSN